MVKVRFNDFGLRPAVLFGDLKTPKGFFCWFGSLPLMCNLLFGFVIFVWHQPTSKWRGLSDTNPKLCLFPNDVFWNMMVPVISMITLDFLCCLMKKNKWKVKSLMKGGWVGFTGSIIICGSVCCASVQSGYNHLLSLSLYIYIYIYIYPHLSSHALSLMGSESLYRVRRPKCIPQTSIDGLEEAEVRLTFWIFSVLLLSFLWYCAVTFLCPLLFVH